jgi:hypothetical protein
VSLRGVQHGKGDRELSEATKGQTRRKQIRETIESNLSRYCPDTIDRLADRIAYDYNLSPYTVRYTYLPMFITVGVLKSLGNGVYSTTEPSPEERREQYKKFRKEREEVKTDG